MPIIAISLLSGLSLLRAVAGEGCCTDYSHIIKVVLLFF